MFSKHPAFRTRIILSVGSATALRLMHGECIPTSPHIVAYGAMFTANIPATTILALLESRARSWWGKYHVFGIM